MKRMSDKAMLDLLDALPMPEGYGWVLRISRTGRGFRLHHSNFGEVEALEPIREPRVYPTARGAIRAYAEMQGKSKQ